jgi:hypothetical protein
MAKKKRDQQKQAAWDEAARRCRLSADEVRMAKELGIGPASLIKNIPSRSQRWKQPVRDWVRELYEKKFGRRKVVEGDVLPAKQGEPPTSECLSGSDGQDDYVPF